CGAAATTRTSRSRTRPARCRPHPPSHTGPDGPVSEDASMKTQRITGWTLALLLAGAASSSAQSQDWGPAPDTGITQTVARISYTQGNASHARGDEPAQWQGADPNVPMTTGDRLYTDQGNLELQLEGGSLVELGPQTDLTALNLTEDVQQFAVKSGSSSF